MECPKCGKVLKTEWDECPVCGIALKAPARGAAKPGPASAAEEAASEAPAPAAVPQGEEAAAGPGAVPAQRSPEAVLPKSRVRAMLSAIISGTASFMTRLIVFTLASQLLYFILFAIGRAEMMADAKNGTILATLIVFILLAVIGTLMCLFRGVRTRKRLAFTAGLALLAVLILTWYMVASAVSAELNKQANAWEVIAAVGSMLNSGLDTVTFVAGWTLWNMAFIGFLIVSHMLLYAVVLMKRCQAVKQETASRPGNQDQPPTIR